MIFIDTHTHLYLEEFDADRHNVIYRAIAHGVKYMMLPNIDQLSIAPMKQLQAVFPGNCFAMMGLHPTSVKENWKEELAAIEQELEQKTYHAIGEVGLDFYWDQTFSKEQEFVFRHQIELALQYRLPLVIHSRKSLEEILKIIKDFKQGTPRGIFHCFPGSLEQAYKVIDLGFKLGIGGVVTFKNSNLGSIVKEVGLQHIVLETDAPFISPVPYRGKRNESAYIPLIAAEIAGKCNVGVEKVAEITTTNAMEIFKSLPSIN